uniref:Uncharacterized protein n=1 Tax=Avena sativa TaxID=4498 RepID=A0ACD5UTV4_AVESA
MFLSIQALSPTSFMNFVFAAALGSWMASPARPTESTGTTQEEAAARQSLMGISQSVPAAGEALSVPNGRMEHGGQDDGGAADNKYRSMLMSIANQSPEPRQQPTPCPRSNGVA